MKKIEELTQLYRTINEVFYDIDKDEVFPNFFYHAFLSGNAELYQKAISEAKVFHEDWIGTIESYFQSLDRITKNAKSGLRYEQEVVAIEKAKKINSDSVRHLAQNTHLIKEVRGDMVVPKKILNTQAEIEYAIYENRFIKTLIDRLFTFVNHRYQIIKNNVESFEKTHFNLKSTFNIEDLEIEMDVDMNIKEEVTDEGRALENHQLLTRVHHLLKKINGLRESNFMEELKDARPVVPPIMQTSILTKNVDYKNCYTLWLYLDRYNILDYDLEVKEKNLPFDKIYLRNVYQTALMTFTTVFGNQKDLEGRYEHLNIKEYKKKSIKNLKKHVKDIVNHPDPFKVENTEMNQYYLEQNKAIFKQNLENHLEGASSYDVGLKRALRDTIAITNALYESYFEFGSDDEDYENMFFARLVKEDLNEELAKAKDKARVARLIRETKEVDYNNSIRLEKRMLKEIERIDKEIVKELKHQAILDAEKARIEERIKIERTNLSKNQGILSDYLSIVMEQREVLSEDQKKFEEKQKALYEKVKAEEQRLIQQARKKASQEYQTELKKIKAKQRLEKQKLAAKIKEERKVQRETLKKTKAKIEKDSEERIRKAKEKITKTYEEKREKINS